MSETPHSDPTRSAATATFPPKGWTPQPRPPRYGADVRALPANPVQLGEAISEEQYNMLFADFRRVQSQLQREQQHFQSALQVSRHELARAQQSNVALHQANQSLMQSNDQSEMRVTELQRELEEQRRLAYDLSRQRLAQQQVSSPRSPSNDDSTEGKGRNEGQPPSKISSKQPETQKQRQAKRPQDGQSDATKPPQLLPFCCQVSPSLESVGSQTDGLFTPHNCTQSSSQPQEYVVPSSLSVLPTTKPIVVRVFSGPPSDTPQFEDRHRPVHSASESYNNTPEATARWCDEPFEPEVLPHSAGSSIVASSPIDKRGKSHSPGRYDDLVHGEGREEGRHGRDDSFRQSFRSRDRRSAGTFPASAEQEGRTAKINKGPGKGGPRHNRWGSGDKEA